MERVDCRIDVWSKVRYLKCETKKRTLPKSDSRADVMRCSFSFRKSKRLSSCRRLQAVTGRSWGIKKGSYGIKNTISLNSWYNGSGIAVEDGKKAEMKEEGGGGKDKDKLRQRES
jgi:hypothetical protein